jgi:hypothetical protein
MSRSDKEVWLLQTVNQENVGVTAVNNDKIIISRYGFTGSVGDQDSSVSVVSWVLAGRPGLGFFLFAIVSRSVLESTKPVMQCVPGA